MTTVSSSSYLGLVSFPFGLIAIAIVLILLMRIFALATVAKMASDWGRNPWGWIFLSLLAPEIALALLYRLGPADY